MSKLDLLAPDSPEAALSRRSLVQTIAGSALAMTFLAGCGGSDDDNNNGGGNGNGNIDQAVLQFALHLEYLEAEFYSYATTGSGLPANLITGTGNAGPTTGGVATNFTSANGRAIAEEIARDELEHVRVVRGALGSATITKPAINLNALNLDLTVEANFVTLARAFEDVGVSAYLGASTVISKTLLATAGRILAVEALHTGNLRLQAIQQNAPGGDLDAKDQAPNSADPLTGNADNYFATDNQALAIPRTPLEVLKIVLNQPNATASTLVPSGGFFPGGLNLSSGNAERLLALG